jgi:DNA mismatch repair protein MutS2
MESEPDICPLGASALTPPAGFLDLLGRSLEGPAALAPDASPQLATLIRERTALQAEAETLIRGRCEQPDLRDRIPRGGRARWRSGRAMLEAPDALAAGIRGVRRGVGSAGRNVLMEPMEAVGVNNRLAELNTRIEREERRILRDLTAVLHGHLNQLQDLLEALTWTDLAFAAGKLSSQLNCAPPELSTAPGVTLDRAYHPLLLLQSAAGQTPRLPVPLTLALHPDQAIVLVTGPNTGGKTVVLKTVGLLVAMAQCGLHIPSEGRCVIGRYTRLMVDVGDRQSLYHHLSTFAGHVEVLKWILDEADSGTLVLLDELGTGTDPEEGAALAMAVLDELLARGAQGVVTTHLTPLKEYATHHDRILNAAMAFDHERLSPTYQLRLGESGASLGLTIAGRGGLPDSVVARARTHLRRL